MRPRYVIFLGRKMRVLDYHYNDCFTVLDPRGDVKRFVHRDNLIFLKG